MHLLDNLSERELQVARLIAWGHTKKEVASKLFISYNTVDSHVKNIYKKMSIRKETELTRIFFVETYDIPVGDNSIKGSLMSIALLVLMVFAIFQKNEFVRVRTQRASSSRTTRTGRRGREDSDSDTYYC